jgi:hypothetical protein
MRTKLLYPLLKGTGGTHESFNAQGRGGIGCVNELGCPVNGETPVGKHALGAIEEAEALLGMEPKRLDPRGRKNGTGRDSLTVDENLSLSDDRESEVGEGRQIARCPDGAL